MKIWIDENQRGFVRKGGLDTYYFLLNDIHEGRSVGNVEYITMTYSEFKKLYPVSTYVWYGRKKS